MIAYLSGTPKVIGQDLIIMTGGVGYGVKVTPSTLSSLSTQGNADLFIYTHVKEEKLELYGFLTIQEKETFELLLGVSGIGPATAMGLVAAGSTQLINAVQNAQVSFFTSIPRVGKKLAQKIIIELRGKLGELKSLDLGPKSAAHIELVEALVSLGFDENKVTEIVANFDMETTDLQTAIKLAMKELA